MCLLANFAPRVITHPGSITTWASSILFFRPFSIRSWITRSRSQPPLLNFGAVGIPSIWPLIRRHHWLRLNTAFILPPFPLLLRFGQSQRSTECSLNSSQFYPKQESTWIIHFLRHMPWFLFTHFTDTASQRSLWLRWYIVHKMNIEMFTMEDWWKKNFFFYCISCLLEVIHVI